MRFERTRNAASFPDAIEQLFHLDGVLENTLFRFSVEIYASLPGEESRASRNETGKSRARCIPSTDNVPFSDGIGSIRVPVEAT